MAKNAKNNKDVKNKKHFFKDFKAELKKVIWPTPKQVVNNTMAVITIVLITAVIVFILDAVFDIINEYGINRLKSTLQNKIVVENVVSDSNNTVDEVMDEEETTEADEADNLDEEENNESSEENVE